MKATIIFFITFIFSMNAFASVQRNVTITNIEMGQTQSGIVLIQTEGEKEDCARPGGWSYVLKVDTEYGRELFRTMLAAYSFGKTIDFRGYRTPLCGFQGIEEIDKIWIY